VPGILCRSASELASRSVFVASMRTTESLASVAEADANNQGNNYTLRNIELADDGPLGYFPPPTDIENYDQPMNQQEFLSVNIDAELDNDNDIDINDTTNGIMAIFLKAVHHELREQVRGRAAREPWLLEILKAPGADWWVRAGQAGVVCKKLGLLYNEPAYYRDIYVWLPDVCWGTEAMPPCVICKTQRRFPLMTFKQNILDVGYVR